MARNELSFSLILFLLCLSIFSVDGAAAWEEPRVITQGGGPSLIKAMDGTYWLAYEELIDNNQDIYLIHSKDLIQWSDPIRVTHHNDTDFHPSLVQTTQGRFFLVFTSLRNGNYDIYVTESDNGIEWMDPSQLTLNNGSDWYPFITKDSQNRLILSYSSRQTQYNGVFIKIFEGGEWSEPISVTEPGSDLYPMVVEGSDRYWLIFVRHTGDYNIRWRANEHEIFLTFSRDLEEWDPPERLTSTKEGAFSLYPSFIRGQDNNLWLSYTSDELGNEEVYIMGSPDGFRWSNPERITRNIEYRESINSTRSFKCDVKSMIQEVEGEMLIAYECAKTGNDIYLVKGVPSAGANLEGRGLGGYVKGIAAVLILIWVAYTLRTR